MWLDLHHILADELFVRNDFLGDSISNIDDAVLIFVSLVIEENVLGAIVCLVDEQQLGGLSMIIILFPSVMVLGNRHGRELFEGLENVKVLFNVLLDHFAVFVLIFHESICDLIEVITKSVVGAHDELGVGKLVRESIVRARLRQISEPKILGAFGTVELDMWGTVSATIAGMKTRSKLIEFPLDVSKIFLKSSKDNGEFSLLFLQENQGSEE